MNVLNEVSNLQFINEFIAIDYTVEPPVCCKKYVIFEIYNIVNKASNMLEDKMCHHKSKDKYNVQINFKTDPLALGE